jgi:D-aminopeptidase
MATPPEPGGPLSEAETRPDGSHPRAGELGIRIGRFSGGRHNAITDVPGVRVGHCTLDQGRARTGVTVILPVEDPWRSTVFAGSHRLNGNGELTGLAWIRESGLLTSPVALTNTHSLGIVRDALVAHEVSRRGVTAGEPAWSLPVVGETWDGVLNDINGFHVRSEHVDAAIAAATGGPVAEGNVGGGTGMITHGFKGGIGTASRVLPEDDGGFTVGVLVQANHGRRRRLAIAGRPIGTVVTPEVIPVPGPPAAEGAGSIIVVVATDAPLLPHQCERLAQRAGLGVGRMGGLGENSSGDLFLCFATGNVSAGMANGSVAEVRMLRNERIDPLFEAVVDATEEAILNAMLAADTMRGVHGTVAYRLDPEALTQAWERLGS